MGRSKGHQRHLGTTAGGLLLALLTGCASFQGAPDWPAAVSLTAADPLYQTYIERYYAADSAIARQLIRNQFIELRVGLLDRTYAGFKDSIYTQRVGSAVGADVATLLLNAVGTAMPQESVKTATSGLSAGIIGSRASIDKNVYFDRTLPALLAQMDGKRSQVRERLLAGMSVDVERYPLMQAASDLDAYYHAGTISGAIAEVTTQASIAKATADEALRKRLPTTAELEQEMKGRGFHVARVQQTSTVQQFSMCLDAEGALKPGLREAISVFLRAKGVNPDAALGLSNFLVAPDSEPVRAAALLDPTLGPTVRACATR